MNEIYKILVKINKDINDIAGMESSFDRYISIKDLLKDQLTKYGQAVREEAEYQGYIRGSGEAMKLTQELNNAARKIISDKLTESLTKESS